MDELRSVFAAQGHANCGDFLKFYLRNDVLLLARGTEKLFDEYDRLFDVQIADVNKNTISSLSFYAGQMHLYRKKAAGMFAINNRRVYACLRRGLRGGITFSSRSVGGEDADLTDFVRLFREQRQKDQSEGKPGVRPDLTTLGKKPAALPATAPTTAAEPPGRPRRVSFNCG